MAIARGELWFAPDCRMADIDFDVPEALIDNFRNRVLGFFVEPTRHLRTMVQEESSLFASAIICAATIESLAKFDPSLRNCQRPIADWLHVNIPQFRQDVGGRSAAAYFDERFRNGLVHEGYIVSLGRLGNLDDVITIDRNVVTINPFLLIEVIANWLNHFCDDLIHGRRDVRAFQHRMKELFEEEVNTARHDNAA